MDYSALLTAAGFTEIHTSTRQLGYHLAGANDWWEIVWFSELRDLVERLPPEALGAFRAAHQGTVEGLRSENGIWLDVETVFARGLKPGG